MRGRVVPLDVSICSNEVFRETCFVELNFCWCWLWCDVVYSLVFDPLTLTRLNTYTWFQKVEHVMFLKLESWKKAYIFKETKIFESGRLQKIGSLLVLGRMICRPSKVKIYVSIQTKKTSPFIEFSSGLCWSMDRTHELYHMDLSLNK